MYKEKLPFGEPIFFKGEYKQDKIYDLYIQMLTCSFKLKKDKIPCIQIKDSKSFFMPNEYLESSNGEIICLVLTSVDLKLFLEQYDVYDLNYVSGWKFKSISGLFTEYIDKWIAKKNEATINKNKGIRAMSKLMLNSLYGKFATTLTTKSKTPYLTEDGIVKYKLTEEQEKNGLYLPVACFITAYARNKTIRTSQAIKTYSINKYGKDMYIYSDTDSIKTTLPAEELKQFCDIDNVKLGFWKDEGTAIRGKFVRQKCYLEEFKINYFGKKLAKTKKFNKKVCIKSFKTLTKIQITCAGMPKSCYHFVNWDTFKTGFSCGGKLTFNHVKRWCYFKRNRVYN